MGIPPVGLVFARTRLISFGSTSAKEWRGWFGLQALSVCDKKWRCYPNYPESAPARMRRVGAVSSSKADPIFPANTGGVIPDIHDSWQELCHVLDGVGFTVETDTTKATERGPEAMRGKIYAKGGRGLRSAKVLDLDELRFVEAEPSGKRRVDNSDHEQQDQRRGDKPIRRQQRDDQGEIWRRGHNLQIGQTVRSIEQRGSFLKNDTQ